jgi:hypothetical protein
MCLKPRPHRGRASVCKKSELSGGGTASMPVREKRPRSPGSEPARPFSRPQPPADRRQSAGLFAYSPGVHCWRQTGRWRKPDSNFWSLNQPSSAGVNAGRHAGHIRHVCFRRAPRINPARDSAIAPRQPHPERKGRSAPGLTPGAADAHLDHRLGPALLHHAAR